MHQTLLEFGARENIDIIILGQCHHWHTFVSSKCALVEYLSCVMCQVMLLVLPTLQYWGGSSARSRRRAWKWPA